jgi:histidyl-tRNA synthetase
LTVPFARFCAQHNINKIKRYHIGKVYRRDQPSIKTGRFREFYQCDYDIAGPSQPMVADAEVLRAFATILNELEIDYVIKLNDRRLLDAAVIIKAKCTPEKFNTVCSSIDKLDKEPWESVSEELTQKGLAPEQIQQIKMFVELKSDTSNKALEKLEEFFEGIDSAKTALKE